MVTQQHIVILQNDGGHFGHKDMTEHKHRTDGWTDGLTDGQTDGWADGLTDGQTDGWTDGQTDGCTDGWTDGQ